MPAATPARTLDTRDAAGHRSRYLSPVSTEPFTHFRPDPRALDGAYVAAPLDGKSLTDLRQVSTALTLAGPPVPAGDVPAGEPQRDAVRPGDKRKVSPRVVIALTVLGFIAFITAFGAVVESTGGTGPALAAGALATTLLWVAVITARRQRPFVTAFLVVVLFLGGFTAVGSAFDGDLDNLAVGMAAVSVVWALVVGALSALLQRVLRRS